MDGRRIALALALVGTTAAGCFVYEDGVGGGRSSGSYQYDSMIGSGSQSYRTDFMTLYNACLAVVQARNMTGMRGERSEELRRGKVEAKLPGGRLVVLTIRGDSGGLSTLVVKCDSTRQMDEVRAIHEDVSRRIDAASR